jgi:hypothetical protein
MHAPEAFATPVPRMRFLVDTGKEENEKREAVSPYRESRSDNTRSRPKRYGKIGRCFCVSTPTTIRRRTEMTIWH